MGEDKVANSQTHTAKTGKAYGDLSTKAMRMRMAERLERVRKLINGESRTSVLENWKTASREM